MKTQKYILFFIVVAVLIVAGFFVVKKAKAPFQGDMQQATSDQVSVNSNKDLSTINQQQINSGQEKAKPQTVDPIENSLSRITKKPFGIYITPKTSPVQPERFQGYHTGVDLETMPEEQNMDVPVNVLCDGKLLMARFVSGYGGVAVQSCNLDGQAVTVVYGHIKLISVKAKIGDQLKTGYFMANLGAGFSKETDGERKHLHLAIHKGSSINILGYVQSKADLSSWLDPSKYLN